MRSPACLKIGLAVGAGTGPELADVFRQVVDRFAELYGLPVRIQPASRVYHSYQSLMARYGMEEWVQATHDDAAHYELFCRELAAAGVPVLFRTAINAQSLYLVRERLHAVKSDLLVGDSAELLLVRDQAQGFYAGKNTGDHSPDVIERTCTFSKELTAKVVAFALREAARCWPDKDIDQVVMAYKFHLLDRRFASWVEDCSQAQGVPICLYQPDTANRNLLQGRTAGRILLIGANEWLDIMHVVLLARFGYGPQENRATRNIYLHPDLSGLAEYQTVHGSADDLVDAGTVNPFATIRAAAAIMEHYGACRGAEAAVDRALARLEELGRVTPDMGGSCSTAEVVEQVLTDLRGP